MLAFATGLLAKASTDIFFGGILAVTLNWKYFKTNDLVLLMTNGVALVRTALITVIQAVLVVLQALTANFIPIVMFGVISFAMHEYTESTLATIDAMYSKFYIYVYRRFIESYGWLLRLMYDLYVPIYNMGLFLAKKTMIRDAAETFATCEGHEQTSIGKMIEIIRRLINSSTDIVSAIITWLLDFTKSELDLRNSIGALQQIPIMIMYNIDCACKPLTRTASTIVRLVSTKTVVELLHHGMNVPVRFLQMFTYGNNLEGVNALIVTLKEFLKHLGIYMDDILEEIVGQVTDEGIVNIPRPFVFGVLSYFALAGAELGNLTVTTMLEASTGNAPALNFEPVFAELHKFAENSGSPVDTLVQFTYGTSMTGTSRRPISPYCPLFTYDKLSFEVETHKQCRCQLSCGTGGQCYNNVMCVPYYENHGLTLHGIPGKSHTPIIMKCTDDDFCGLSGAGQCNTATGRCFCRFNMTVSYLDGKCHDPNSDALGLCKKTNQTTQCQQALPSHTMNPNCNAAANSVDEPIGNPFSCTVSSFMEAGIGAAYVATSVSKEVVLQPALLGSMDALMNLLKTHQGGISYRRDLSCEHRKASQPLCNCQESPFCNQPTLTHNVMWPMRKAAFYLGLGMTEGISYVQDWAGAAITTVITAYIDAFQAVTFVALNLFEGIQDTATNPFKRPFDVETGFTPAKLCSLPAYASLGLCSGTGGCIGWYYDGNDPNIRELFYSEQEHWCGSLVVEPVIMRIGQLVKTMTNFVERAASSTFSGQECPIATNFLTDNLAYINVLFNDNGNQRQTSWTLFASDKWCKSYWYPTQFACGISKSVMDATDLMLNIIRQIWRNMFAVLFFRTPLQADIAVHNRACDAYKLSNNLCGLVGTTVEQATRTKASGLGEKTAHVIAIGTEMTYAPLLAGSLFLSEQIQNLLAENTANNIGQFLDDTVINTIIFASRYVFVSAAKVLQMLQVVAYGRTERDEGGAFVRSMYQLIDVFATFFNKHGIEVMRILMQVFAGFMQILQGQGVGQFMQAFEQLFNYMTKVIASVFTKFWPWFKDVLGPIGDMLGFVETTVCSALQAVGGAIDSVRGLIKPAGGFLSSIGSSIGINQITKFISPITKPISDTLDRIPGAALAMNFVPVGRGLKVGMKAISFMGNLDETLDSITNLDCSVLRDETAPSQGATAPTAAPTQSTLQDRNFFEHRRRRQTVRRRLEEKENSNITSVNELFFELQSTLDWSGTTLCAKIGQVETPPQTPYEIAMWTSCAEYRIRAAAISQAIEVPANIFDDWYSVVEWGSLMAIGSLHWWTTNATIEELTQMGYPGNALMQARQGLTAMYSGFTEEFSMNEAIDTTFANTGTDTTDLKNVLQDLPAFELPSGAAEFGTHVAKGAESLLQAAQSVAPEQSEPRRRLLLLEESYEGTDLENGIKRGTTSMFQSITNATSAATGVFSGTSELKCPLITEPIESILEIVTATLYHYQVTVKDTAKDFQQVMLRQEYDEDPLISKLSKASDGRRYPPYTQWIGTELTDDGGEINWPGVSPSEALQALTDFLTISGVRESGAKNTLDLPLLKNTVWDWIMEMTESCNHKQVLYDTCRNTNNPVAGEIHGPKATIKRTKTRMIQTVGLMAGIAYAVPSPVASMMLITSPTVLSYVFLNTRYGWIPTCAPMLPMCAFRDFQLLMHDTLSINKCFCQTEVGSVFVNKDSKFNCARCVFHDDTESDKKISYDKCPARTVPAPFWAPMQALAWQFPKIFEFVFKSPYSPTRFLGTENIINEFPTGESVGELDKACVYVHIFDVALVATALPMTAKLVALAYGQFLTLGLQILVWFGTVLAVARPELIAPPVAQTVQERVTIPMNPPETMIDQDVVLDIVRSNVRQRRRTGRPKPK